jgi:hypothetical protein
VHRDLEITVAPEATDDLLGALKEMDGVITLSVRRGESVKPPGDVISATAMNHAADEIVSQVAIAGKHGAMSISTSTVDSLIDPENLETIRQDVDEVLWEEAETALRRHTRTTLNFFLSAAAGGVIATCALLSTNRATEASALVAAGIIAPVFEPFARIALGAVNRRWRIVGQGVLAAVGGFAILIAAAVLTMLIFRSGEHAFLGQLLGNPTVHEIDHPPAVNLIVSAAGAVAGAVMVAAGRFTQLAGPLVALQLLPAAATLGAALEVGDGGLAASSIGRLAIDIGMVVVACLTYFTYKHLVAHARRETWH